MTIAEVLQAALEPEDKFTDAALGGRFARTHLKGRFYYTTALGWLQWDGGRWKPVVDEMVHEECRKWVLRKYREACDDWQKRKKNGLIKDKDEKVSDDPAVKGWTAAQGRQRLTAIPATARGHEAVFRLAEDFDADHYVLNTASGEVDLRTKTVKEHHPSMMHTKITICDYVPEAAERAIVAQALAAYPADCHDWLQVRLGEAVTGLGGKELVVLDGTGNNGKTALTGALNRALGGYGALLPNTLLLRGGAKGAATPEKMELKGIRFGYIEETPEGGFLDANAAKELMDAESIKGRQLYRSFVEWIPTHSIFLNTNNIPHVSDTDDGAWRRLKRIECPYRFRDVDGGEPLILDVDRAADVTLKRRLNETPHGQEAVLAWAIEGAYRLLSADSLKQAAAEPESVTDAVTRWRSESDDILSMFERDLEFGDDSDWITKRDFYEAYRVHVEAGGGRPSNVKTLTQRLLKHGVLRDRMVAVYRVTASAPPSLPPERLRGGLVNPPASRERGWAGIRFQPGRVDAGSDFDPAED